MIDYRKMGLTDEQVHQRMSSGYVNISDDNISKTKKQIVIDHTLTYFNILNLFLAIIILSTKKWMNMTFMFVVIINSIIGIYQEFKVKKIIDKLTVVTVKKVKAIRNHELITIPVEQLVLDDIVYLETGNQIGTDCVVVESEGLEINEALLTGESQPIKKDSEDKLLAGSFVVAGSGYAKVIHVGNDNYSAKIVRKAKHKNKASSEMKVSIEKVIKILSIVIIPVGIILFLSQLKATPMNYATAIVRTVGGIIGMIPEGLVLLTSLSFIVGVGKLAQKRALVQEMEAIEALARVNVLCLDKTGTITTGELEVEKIDYMDNQNHDDIDVIMSAMTYCFDDDNVTQKALKKYFKKIDFPNVQAKIPFSSQRKMRAITLNNKHYVLGAPDFLLNRENPLLQKVNDYSSQGYRVLLLGMSDMLNESTSQVGKVLPMVLIIIRDCLREDAKETLAFFDDLCVDVCILSGDNPITVSKVAQMAGLKHYNRYIDASQLPSDEKELEKIIGDYHIFGRVKPEQKEAIIHSFQKQGKVVGMVGDGVNDVLALKDADCGIAMASGSDAVKQAAHIVLLDSNFASMQDVVKEGRAIIADIERVSSLYLTKTVYSTMLCLIFAFLRKSYPFTPLQLSLISGLAIGIPSFLLTFERSSTLALDGFLKHVVSTAVPCGITMVIYMLFITFLGTYFHFDAKLLSTYYLVVAGFISFLVVYLVCRPLNRLRTSLIVVVTSLFYLALLLFYRLLDICSLLSFEVLGVIPLCLSSIFILNFIQMFFEKFYKLYRNVLNKLITKNRR